MLVTALGMAIMINKDLAVVFMVALPVLGTILFLIVRTLRPLYGKMQKAVDLVNRVIQENLIAIRVVKSYVRGTYEKEKLE